LKLEKGEVVDWLDCGNKNATLATNQTYLSYLAGTELVHKSIKLHNSSIIEPCYIDESVVLTNSVIGPYVSIGKNVHIENSVISNSIIQSNTIIKNKLITQSMVGNNVRLVGKFEDLSIGDYTTTE
jgi:glucose-1-phosphate thymidylyltransferase